MLFGVPPDRVYYSTRRAGRTLCPVPKAEYAGRVAPENGIDVGVVEPHAVLLTQGGQGLMAPTHASKGSTSLGPGKSLPKTMRSTPISLRIWSRARTKAAGSSL